jgi:N-acyl-D-amino-acid deacylase
MAVMRPTPPLFAQLGFLALFVLLAQSVSAHTQESAPREPTDFDLLILGGEVLDGTGSPARRADLGVRADRIAAIGTLAGKSAATTIDATGRIVAPGFLDLHAHADVVALRRNDARNFVAMGVTSIITGNCGGSVEDVAAHLQAIEARGIALNYGTLIGHGTVRSAVMGTANREPSAEELQQMRELVARAMKAGAFGMSTGLIYVPGTYAKLDELIALSRVVAEHGGRYVSHMRNEGDALLDAVREAIAIGEGAKLPIHLSHLKVSGRNNHGESDALVELLERTRSAGLTLTGDQYAYTASSTSLDVLFPSSALSIGRQAFCAKLAEDAEFRERMVTSLQEDMERSGFGDLGYAQVAHAPGSPAATGLRLPAIAERERGAKTPRDQAETAIDLMVRSNGARIQMIYHKMAEPDVERIMKLPFVAIASDAGIRAIETADKPHPRGSGNNPRVLGHYVRERKVLDLPLAVHKMTALPARSFQIRDRGEIRTAAFADLVVFDPATILDGATYENPTEAPTGIDWVIVNGEVVMDHGAQTKKRPGKVLRAGD